MNGTADYKMNLAVNGGENGFDAADLTLIEVSAEFTDEPDITYTGTLDGLQHLISEFVAAHNSGAMTPAAREELERMRAEDGDDGSDYFEKLKKQGTPGAAMLARSLLRRMTGRH